MSEAAELWEAFSERLDFKDRPLMTRIAQILPEGPRRRALDVGCGTGRHTAALADLYEEVVGTDIADDMIDIARRKRSRPGVRYEVRDAWDLTPHHDGSFDLVFAFSSLAHSPEDPARLIKLLSSLVAPGGSLITFEAERPDDHGEEGWLVNHGFRIARLAYDVTQDVEVAASALRFVFHETWGEVASSCPLASWDDFQKAYSAALPGATFTRDLFPCFMTALWHRPADEPHARADALPLLSTL